jgi:hypothetical protein
MQGLIRDGLPNELERSVETLLYEVQVDMLGRWAYLVFHQRPPIRSHEDLKAWCESLQLALGIFDHRWEAYAEGRRVPTLDVALPLLEAAGRAVASERGGERTRRAWNGKKFLKKIVNLQWTPLRGPRPLFTESDFLSLTKSIWQCMRALGRGRPPEPFRAPDERAARHILDVVILWCAEHRPSGPPVDAATPASDWEFSPGRFRYKQDWYDLSNTALKLLERFVKAKGMTLNADEISKLTPARVSPSRCYARVAELRKILKKTLKLLNDYDPLPPVDREAWRLSLP